MKLFHLFLLCIIFFLFSCQQPIASVSSVPKKTYYEDKSSSFSSKPSKKSKKVPQMGFYAKRERINIFAAMRFKIKLLFASYHKKHKWKNEQRATSQSYSNKRLKNRQKVMTKNFIRVKKSKHRRRKYKPYDRGSDSFSSPNKKFKKDK